MSLVVTTNPIPLVTDAGGVMRVGSTRVSLDSVIYAFNNGATAEEIAQDYPSLKLGDVYAVIGYYLQHRAEVDDYLCQREQQRQIVQQMNEAKFDPQGVRARLLARRNP